LVEFDGCVCLIFHLRKITPDTTIYKYDSEEMLKTKLKGYFSPKLIESASDTLIATQKIRRIGQDTSE
jgi:hypothetical protein